MGSNTICKPIENGLRLSSNPISVKYIINSNIFYSLILKVRFHNCVQRFSISDVCQNSFKNQLVFGKFGTSEGTSEPDILCCARVLFGFPILLF